MRRVLGWLGKKSSNLQAKKHTRSLSCNPLKNIVYKAVQNRHCLVGDTSIRVYLLEHYETKSDVDSTKPGRIRQTLVDVGAVRFLSDLLSLLLLTISCRCGGLRSLLRGFCALAGLSWSFGSGGSRCFAGSGSGFGCHW